MRSKGTYLVVLPWFGDQLQDVVDRVRGHLRLRGFQYGVNLTTGCRGVR